MKFRRRKMAQKSPACRRRQPGVKTKNYLAETGAGAGAEAVDGQHDAARNEAAAAMMISLTIFILVLLVGWFSTRMMLWVDEDNLTAWSSVASSDSDRIGVL